MKHVCKDAEVAFGQGWLANKGLGFQDPELETRFTAHRQRLMAPILRLWTLFGTASVLATLARREFTQWDLNLGLLTLAARFLALRYFVGISSCSAISALHIASFPLRAIFLVACSVHFTAFSKSISFLIPLMAVYDVVLYPCIEQVGGGGVIDNQTIYFCRITP